MYGILWDCDGTIMDTERLYAYAWQTHLKQFGLSIPEDEIKQFVGVDDRIVHSFYSDQVDLENFDQTMHKLGFIIENSLDEKIIFQDANQLLYQLSHLEFKQACASASPYNLLSKKLQKFKVDSYFDFIIGGDQVNRNKPYPDIYNKAIEKLGTSYNLVIEDSPTGILSGKASGSYVLAIDRGMFSKEQLSEADQIVEMLDIEIINKIFKSL
ncbi:HAD family phosphatase [Acidimicrobiaceae bacterium]|nr:HAD family phosphatase [Acidimicrobiaceae bacterium]